MHKVICEKVNLEIPTLCHLSVTVSHGAFVPSLIRQTEVSRFSLFSVSLRHYM